VILSKRLPGIGGGGGGGTTLSLLFFWLLNAALFGTTASGGGSACQSSDGTAFGTERNGLQTVEGRLHFQPVDKSAHDSAFPFQGALQRMVERVLCLLIFGVGDRALFALDFKLKQFFLDCFEQR